MSKSKQTAISLYNYQQRWIADKSRFKMGLWSRQTGKSFVVSLGAALNAAEAKRGQNKILLSAGLRQSKELMEKVSMHFKAMNIAASQINETFFSDAKYTLLQIVLNNGSKVIGLPANPDTARGFSGDVILDEFAFHTDSRKIWTALYPTISRGYSIEIVTTPQGFGNKSHELWSADNGYSKHMVDIYSAIAGGCPQDADELRKGLDDEDAWHQEYECQFIDDSSILLSYELITACQDVKSAAPVTLEDYDLSKPVVENPAGRFFAGLDVGRKKDLSVLTIVEQLGDVYYTRLILEMPKTAYSLQREVTTSICLRNRVARLCIDSTGIGDNLAEDIQKDLGTYAAEKVVFTNSSKSVMATRMLQCFQDRKIRIPVDRHLRDDLHKIKKTTTAAGNVRFDASSDDKGHADRFWSMALSLEATDKLQEASCIWL